VPTRGKQQQQRLEWNVGRVMTQWGGGRYWLLLLSTSSL
jgi:hypothetical protein